MTNHNCQTDPDLYAWVSDFTTRLRNRYPAIRRRAKEDPGTAGDAAEELVAELLRQWMPPTYPIVTKGRILSHDGTASPQVDIVILKPGYPVQLASSKLYMASGVAAAIECKLTLETSHLMAAARTAAKIADLCIPRSGTPYRELVSPITYGLFAISHDYAVANAPEHVGGAMRDRSFASSPRQMLDFVCLADVVTDMKNIQCRREPSTPDPRDTTCEGVRVFSGSYRDCDPPGPIGSLIAYLLVRLAWEDPSLRPFAEFYRLANLLRDDSGGEGPWDDVALAPTTEAELIARRSATPITHDWVASAPTDWDEWSFNLS